MTLCIIGLPGNERTAAAIAGLLNAEVATITLHHFPDGETSLRVDKNLAGCKVALVCTLDQPDPKLCSLLFAAELARDLGASSVGLVAPYLAYMRQDTRFHPLESITAHYFPRLLSKYFDWLVTVDPHLHRITSLDQVYGIPAQVVHAAEAMGRWIRENIDQPGLIGPDEESAQWVSVVAHFAQAPYIVLSKVRHGDLDVSMTMPDVSWLGNKTPVIVDDIASSARTLIAASGIITGKGAKPPVCAVIHALFAGDALDKLKSAGVERVVSCNTVVHESNAIFLDQQLATAVKQILNGVA